MAKYKLKWTIQDQLERLAVLEQWGEHMRTVIDRLIYDTETATEIANWSNGIAESDYQIEETLYKTANGNYFIFVIGGKLTSYASTDATGAPCGGCAFEPLTRYEGAKWAAYRELDHLLDTEFPDELEYA